jgi:hypothetical protein
MSGQVDIVKGFSGELDAVDRKLVVGSHGGERTGKSHFSATAPDPIGVIPLDRNTRWTMGKVAKEYGKVIVFPKKDFIRQDATEMLRMKKYYRKHVNGIKEALYSLYDSDKIKTVVIDTGTQLWEDIMFAHFGRYHRVMPRDRGVPNQEMADLLTACPHHMVVTHRSAEIWKADKGTGKYKCGGFPHIGYYCNVMIEHGKERVRGEDGKIDRDQKPQFVARVSDCTANPELVGDDDDSTLVGMECDFSVLGTRVYPGTKVREWR